MPYQPIRKNVCDEEDQRLVEEEEEEEEEKEERKSAYQRAKHFLECLGRLRRVY